MERSELHKVTNSLARGCDLLSFIGWVEFFASVVVAIAFFANAEEDCGILEDPMILAGIAIIVSGIAAVTVANFFAAIGRFVIEKWGAKE